jgi:hypothetical protein
MGIHGLLGKNNSTCLDAVEVGSTNPREKRKKKGQGGARCRARYFALFKSDQEQ